VVLVFNVDGVRWYLKAGRGLRLALIKGGFACMVVRTDCKLCVGERGGLG
jgi:hypothetical protein